MNTRFSPPRDKADLLKILIDDGSPFNELRDILFFAAVIGWREGRRVPLAGKGEAIRWDTMNNRLGTEEVMDMIAVAANADDRELLAAERHDERVDGGPRRDVGDVDGDGGRAADGDGHEARRRAGDG